MSNRNVFDNSLEELNQKVFRLGKIVNSRVDASMQSLVKQDLELANQVVTGDLEVNEIQSQIEESCMLLIATQQPMATDLRKIVAAFKLSINLERIGDLAVDIAKHTIRTGEQKALKPLVDLPRMADIVQQMVVLGIEAYKMEDAEAAIAMAKMDDEVDHLYAQVFRELLVFMMEDPKTISQATYLIFVGRFLERMGDYCTNIAEEVVYVETGKRSDLNL
ncbi:phosphate uptake regulator, PhoU [Desulfitobacterium dichloroeliminans LMG P-21439]|uniref:Phosphate-specific transport system accessory protein PhoU n=1 Tax=Desulfitobacterium dichloroeliminans (strain LMG P-21439 / DCA1) TaxID=871963 RepID=L0F798_DESDL|nr:phosphate signaling complex protein PhoU [Desulfitobacterium dichloroeliminans]AGA68506.1 phosphate uptake regulator, PhoU [Desulfitobacterium dichloroeliminans LMG P-21439]